jgi:hypothetical protein
MAAATFLTPSAIGGLATEITLNEADKLAVYDNSAGEIGYTNLADVAGFGLGAVAAGSTLTLTQAAHAGRVINLDTAAGSTVTLPAATGSGAIYKFRVSVLATSNNHIVKAASADDSMDGIIVSMDDTSANAVAFAAVAGTSDTITLNRSTTGSVTVGEFFEVQDIAEGRFSVRGTISNTGTPATPFSATVS